VSLSNYAESALINHLLGKTAFSMPATVYVALFTADPGEAGSLSNEVPAAHGYARSAITSNMSSSAGGSVSSNTASIVFGPNTSSDWGTITHVALIDSPTLGDGNILVSGELSVPRLIQVGDKAEFEIGDLDLAFD
jgi:hypothetical protein